MRITIELDSATPEEARDFIVGWQRGTTSPGPGTGTDPTVRVMGKGWGVTTPPMRMPQLREFLAGWLVAFDAHEQQEATP